MQTERDRQAQEPQTPHAPEDETLRDEEARRTVPSRSGAWDPYEVWRTRVKSSQDRPQGRAE